MADLMTVLAVTGLFGALTLLPHAEEKEGLSRELEEAQARIDEMVEQLEACAEQAGELESCEERVEELEAEVERLEQRLAEQEERHEAEVTQMRREAAKNREMFRAIQDAQEVVDEISAAEDLQFEEDQTLRFGEDLVRFAINGIEPEWRPTGRAKLRRFCRTLSERLSKRAKGGAKLRDLFTVQVEGHTDTTRCPDDANCNWWISAGRAASFVALMRNEEFCPGGADLNLRPVGYADSKPPGGERDASREERRRIAVRLVPDYRTIIGEH